MIESLCFSLVIAFIKCSLICWTIVLLSTVYSTGEWKNTVRLHAEVAYWLSPPIRPGAPYMETPTGNKLTLSSDGMDWWWMLLARSIGTGRLLIWKYNQNEIDRGELRVTDVIWYMTFTHRINVKVSKVLHRRKIIIFFLKETFSQHSFTPKEDLVQWKYSVDVKCSSWNHQCLKKTWFVFKVYLGAIILICFPQVQTLQVF